MRTINYKRDSMIAQCAGCMALAMGSAVMAFWLDGLNALFFACLALGLPVAAFALGIRALGDCVALRFDRDMLHVTTLFGGGKLAWSQLRDLRREQMTQSLMFGLIKQEVGRYLVIVGSDGPNSERKFKLNEKLLDLPRSAIPALIEDMSSAWAGAARTTREAPRASDQAQEESLEPGFDPDAALERYLSRRSRPASDPSRAAPPARGGFGRKIA